MFNNYLVKFLNNNLFNNNNLVKFFNNNKPFVDDLEFSVESAEVCIRSSSRVGDSDFGVNAKRINWIADKLREKGWAAPGVSA